MATTLIVGAEAATGALPSRTFSRPELNSLRFLAFLLVYIDHCLPINSRIDDLRYAGAFGVPVFFILSAYLIVSLLIRERTASGTINLPFFYIRRILRIWPLYLTTLLGGYIIGRLHPDIVMPRRMVAAFLLLLGNVYVSKSGWTLSPASILWSISVEEQFYFIVPVAGRIGTRFLRVVCWVVFFAAFPMLFWYGSHPVADADLIRVNSLLCFQFFAIGGLVAFHPAVGLQGRRLGLRIALVGAGLLLFVAAAISFAALLEKASVLGYLSTDLEILAGSLSIFYGFLYYPARRQSLFGYLGLISYGLYVFHPWCLEFVAELRDHWYHETPVANLIVNVVALLLSILIAAVSYRFFEKPILRIKQRFEIIRTIRVARDTMPPASPTEPALTPSATSAH